MASLEMPILFSIKNYIAFLVKIFATTLGAVFALGLLCVIGYAISYFIFYLKESLFKSGQPPVVGTIFHQLFSFSTRFDYFTSLARRYKIFRFILLSHSDIYTTDPANIEHILKIKFSNYPKGQFNYDILKDAFGDGIFAVDGEKWRHQRKLASHEFSTRVLRGFSSAVFRSKAAELTTKVAEFAATASAVNMQDLFRKSTMDSIFKIGFGVDLNTLSESDEVGTSFLRAFDDSLHITFRRYVDIFWKAKRLLNVGLEAQLKKNLKVIDEFVFKLIHLKRVQMKTRVDDNVKEDILSRFVKESEEDPTITDRYLRDIFINFLLAGKDTTASTLTWFFYMMCKNPIVQEKVVTDINEATATGSKGLDIDDFVNSLTEEALDSMHYLHAAVTETLRLFPAVPEDGKIAREDDVLPDGFKVRKGDAIGYAIYAMGRMTYLWGEDAEEFRPERWLENGVFQPASSFQFISFNAGLRICLGKDFAYKQMKILAATLLHFFKFRLEDPSRVASYKIMFTLHMDKGLPVVVFSRFS